MILRAATADDYPYLQDIENRAGVMFIEAGMPEIAEHPPPTVEELAAAAALFVVVDGDDRLGYAWVEIVDGHTHLEQLSVVPERGGRGIGTQLLDAVADWARARGDTEVTLTTFRHIAFNMPLYERRGYVEIPTDQRPPGLVELMGEEATHFLDPTTRVAMRRRL